jgi:DNA-binding GntR family transcriptional regulator
MADISLPINNKLTLRSTTSKSFNMISPLYQRPIYVEVAECVCELIYHETPRPGDSIDDTVLCEQLDISRTPLRESPKVLHAENLMVNREFHRAIQGLVGNSWLFRISKELHNVLQLARQRQLTKPGHLQARCRSTERSSKHYELVMLRLQRWLCTSPSVINSRHSVRLMKTCR